MPFVITPAKNTPADAWKELISLLKRFRQAKDKNRSVWPEARAIREIIKRSSTALKFPRAAFGLPIIFHFKDDVPPQTMLKEASREDEGEKARFASPLILRPLLCSDGKAVGLALLLEGSRVMLERLELVEQTSQQKYTVQGKLEASDTRSIHVLQGEKDVLKAFMHFLKSGGKSSRERRQY